ncbi:MAG: nodulation protein NfeD [Chlorobiaceae bacterium]|nr:nodulation protein NfeD [Chlorobiaceae bacterium]NTW63251.1 nodulation protein NfeD [Chlorobiaceae bacterium]
MVIGRIRCNRVFGVHLFFIAVVTAIALIFSPADGAENLVSRIVIKGSVNPGSAGFFARALHDARQSGSDAVLVELDTPGGLVSSLRSMVQEIMASPIPVIVYVYPSGAQAASAGALLMLSAHVAAMAPGTEIGAAHPVGVGGRSDGDDTIKKKTVNDLAAFARSLAEKRGRNALWAEKAVTESVSSTAQEALQAGVIDMISEKPSDVLARIRGLKIETVAGEKMFTGAAFTIREIRPTFKESALMIIADPNLAYILFLAGIAGLYFELATPGAIFPGVAGAISLLLALYSMQTLSVNVTGLLLLLLAVLFLALELFITSGGILAIAGLVALFAGSIMLFDLPGSGITLSLQVILPVFILFSIGIALLLLLVFRSGKQPPFSGKSALIGQSGRVIRLIETDKPGKVFVHGELWDASASERIVTETEVLVTGIEGMKLTVKTKQQE